MQSKMKTLFNELNKHVKQINHAHKTKVRAHTYRDTTEKNNLSNK